MKRAALVGIMVAVVVAALLVYRQPSSVAGGPERSQQEGIVWEYKSVARSRRALETEERLDGELNQQGRGKWELVTVFLQPDQWRDGNRNIRAGGDPTYWFLFKRPRAK